MWCEERTTSPIRRGNCCCTRHSVGRLRSLRTCRWCSGRITPHCQSGTEQPRAEAVATEKRVHDAGARAPGASKNTGHEAEARRKEEEALRKELDDYERGMVEIRDARKRERERRAEEEKAEEERLEELEKRE